MSDAPQSNSEVIELNVRQNAYDFVEEALRYAERGADDCVGWKFAVILGAQAIELLLKARLAMEHPLLVQADPDRGTPGRTVDVRSAIRRLAGAGVVLPTMKLTGFCGPSAYETNSFTMRFVPLLNNLSLCSQTSSSSHTRSMLVIWAGNYMITSVRTSTRQKRLLSSVSGASTLPTRVRKCTAHIRRS